MRNRVAVGGPIDPFDRSYANARLGIILFIAAEMMLFAGLIAGYVVLRFGSGNFEGMPRLPIGLIAASTPALLLSSVALIVAGRGLRRGDRSRFKLGSVATFILGSLFMILQVVEWNQLLMAGVSPDDNVYGGMFYMLSWVHGLHVLGGIILLAILALRASRGSFSPVKRNFVVVASIYWHFVTLVWLGLFVILFLL